MYKLLCKYMHLFLLGKYLEEQWLGQMVGVYFYFNKLSNCFQNGYTTLH